jgi:hypothetical protein
VTHASLTIADARLRALLARRNSGRREADAAQ